MMNTEKKQEKKYKKPKMVARSAPKRSYVAGCAVDTTGDIKYCVYCERAR